MCKELNFVERVVAVFTGNCFSDCDDVISGTKESEKIISKLQKDLKRSNDINIETENRYDVCRAKNEDLSISLQEKAKLIEQKDKVIEDYIKSINKLKNQLTVLKNDLTTINEANLACKNENSVLTRKLKDCNEKLKAKLKEVESKANVTCSNNTKKLTCEEIKAAKAHHEAGRTLTDIAEELDVSTSTLSRAIACKSYKHCCEKKK